MRAFFAIAITIFLVLLSPWMAPVARAQSAVPQYEILDVRILTYQPDRGWSAREHTSEVIEANKKDWSVRLGRGWIGIDNARFVQGPLSLSELLVLMGVPTEGHDPNVFPFVPNLAGPYISVDINAEGDFSSRRWYARDADSEKGYYLLPVGTSLITLDLFQLEGAPKQDGVAWWARLVLYESKEAYTELEPSSDDEGFEFSEEDVRDPTADEGGLDFSEEDVREPDVDEEGLEFTDDDVRELGADEDGLEFTEEDLQDLSREEDELDFSEEDVREPDADEEGLEFTDDDVREPGADEDGLEFTEEDLQDRSGEEDELDFSEEDVPEPDADEEGLEFTDDDVREPWQRDMTDAQRQGAERYRNQLIACAQTGAGCPEGLDAEAVQAEYETNPDEFDDLARSMAEDSVLGMPRDENGWPSVMPEHEARQAQQDYEQVQACISGPSACPDYIHKETAEFFFENADPEAADATIRDIIVKEVSAKNLPEYEVEDQ